MEVRRWRPSRTCTGTWTTGTSSFPEDGIAGSPSLPADGSPQSHRSGLGRALWDSGGGRRKQRIPQSSRCAATARAAGIRRSWSPGSLRLVVGFFFTMPFPAAFGAPFSTPRPGVRASCSSGRVQISHCDSEWPVSGKIGLFSGVIRGDSVFIGPDCSPAVPVMPVSGTKPGFRGGSGMPPITGCGRS